MSAIDLHLQTLHIQITTKLFIPLPSFVSFEVREKRFLSPFMFLENMTYLSLHLRPNSTSPPLILKFRNKNPRNQQKKNPTKNQQKKKKKKIKNQICKGYNNLVFNCILSELV